MKFESEFCFFQGADQILIWPLLSLSWGNVPRNSDFTQWHQKQLYAHFSNGHWTRGSSSPAYQQSMDVQYFALHLLAGINIRIGDRSNSDLTPHWAYLDEDTCATCATHILSLPKVTLPLLNNVSSLLLLQDTVWRTDRWQINFRSDPSFSLFWWNKIMQ